MEPLIERIAQGKYKTVMDMRSGFWQVSLTKRAAELSSFITPDGRVFAWQIMPYGLGNAPSTFQEMMLKIIGMVKRKGSVKEVIKHRGNGI